MCKIVNGIFETIPIWSFNIKAHLFGEIPNFQEKQNIHYKDESQSSQLFWKRVAI